MFYLYRIILSSSYVSFALLFYENSDLYVPLSVCYIVIYTYIHGYNWTFPFYFYYKNKVNVHLHCFFHKKSVNSIKVENKWDTKVLKQCFLFCIK